MVYRVSLSCVLGLLWACAEGPTVELEGATMADASAEGGVDARADAQVPSGPRDAASAVPDGGDVADARVLLDARVVVDASAPPPAECVDEVDCVAERGVARCERGLVRWSCTAGACVPRCEGGCTEDCQCSTGMCRNGGCVSGPTGVPCPSCAFPDIGAVCGIEPLCPGLCLAEARGFPAGYVTFPCTADGDCGTGAHCEAAAGGSFCVKSCSNAADCRPGYACTFPSESSTALACWPTR